jgi:hypothetical protein
LQGAQSTQGYVPKAAPAKGKKRSIGSHFLLVDEIDKAERPGWRLIGRPRRYRDGDDLTGLPPGRLIVFRMKTMVNGKEESAWTAGVTGPLAGAAPIKVATLDGNGDVVFTMPNGISQLYSVNGGFLMGGSSAQSFKMQYRDFESEVIAMVENWNSVSTKPVLAKIRS